MVLLIVRNGSLIDMLQLILDQIVQIECLQLQCDMVVLVQLLGEVWFEVLEQFQVCWFVFVVVVLECVYQFGLKVVVEQVCYVSLCCLWGSNFEVKLGFEWVVVIGVEFVFSFVLCLYQFYYQLCEELLCCQVLVVLVFQVLLVVSFDKVMVVVDVGFVCVMFSCIIYFDQLFVLCLFVCDLVVVIFVVVEFKFLQVYFGQDVVWCCVDFVLWVLLFDILFVLFDEFCLLQVFSCVFGVGVSVCLQLVVSIQVVCGV